MGCNLEWIFSFMVMNLCIFSMECTLSLIYQMLQKAILNLKVLEDLVLRIQTGIFSWFSQNTYHRINVKEEQLESQFLCFQSFDRQQWFFIKYQSDSFLRENRFVWFCPNSSYLFVFVEDFSGLKIHLIHWRLLKQIAHQHWIFFLTRDWERQLRWEGQKVCLIFLRVFEKLNAWLCMIESKLKKLLKAIYYISLTLIKIYTSIKIY